MNLITMSGVLDTQIGLRDGKRSHVFGPLGSVHLGMRVSVGAKVYFVVEIKNQRCSGNEELSIGWCWPMEDKGDTR
ncbi:MAG: hypothetical protein ACYDEY_14700 [Acidimicrobiales bacterium]